MTGENGENGKRGKPKEAGDRQARLEQALRANLLKRKTNLLNRKAKAVGTGNKARAREGCPPDAPKGATDPRREE